MLKTRFKQFKLNSKKYKEILIKLWVSFIVLSFISLLISGVFSYNKSSNFLEEKISVYAVELTKQLSENLKYELTNFEYLCNDFSFVNSMRSGISEANINNSYELLNLEKKFINEIGAKLFINNSIENVFVILNNNKLIKYAESEVFEKVSFEKINEISKNSYGKPKYYYSYTIKKILLIKPIVSKSDNNQIGTMVLIIKPDIFKKTLSNLNLDNDTNIFILNENSLIYNKTESSIKQDKIDHLLKLLKTNKRKSSWNDLISTNDKNYFVAVSSISDSGFYVVETIPYNFMKKESYSIGLVTLLISSLSFFFAALISILLTVRMSKPMEELITKERIHSLSQMITSISHNTKTSIASMSGQNYIINDLINEMRKDFNNKKLSGKNIKNQLDELYNSTQDMKIHLKHVNNLITTARNHFSKKYSSSFVLHDMLENIKLILDFELKLSYCKLIVKNKLDKKFIIYSDQSCIMQVIINLILNALYEYKSNYGGKIELNIEKRDTNILFSVKDNAGGIKKEIKNKLFREMITTKGKEGTGMGLYVSNLIITGELKGEMWFESKNSKTVFYVKIPNKKNTK